MKNKIYLLLKAAFGVSALFWIGWWLLLNVFGRGPSGDDFTDSYGVTALFGSLIGLIAALQWGGFKSRFGRAISFFSLGMGLQFMGQLVYTLYFRWGGVELAFPSVGDVPYLLSNIAYILGVASLLSVLCYPRKFYKPAWVTGAAVAATGAVLLLMTVSFLKIAASDERGSLYQVLNVAYPLIQAVYFFLGIIALFQSRMLAGAKMFGAVSIMLIALMTQFAADFLFLNRSYHETWQPGGVSELVYLLAYTLMGISIIVIDNVRKKSLVAPAESEGV